MNFLYLSALLFTASSGLDVTDSTYATFWQVFNAAEVKAWSCTSTEDTRRFLEIGTDLSGSAEVAEAFAKGFENALIRKPDCVLSAANQLTAPTLKRIVQENILVPTFRDVGDIDAVIIASGRRYARVWAEWSRVPADPLERLASIDRFAWSGPIFLKKKRLPELRKLGRLLSEKEVSQPNPHQPKLIDVYKTLEFPGLTIYGVVRRDELLLIQITISSPLWPIRRNLRVGANFAQVRAVLGEPSEVQGNTMGYQGETEQIDFYVDNQKVTRILFTYYAD